MAREYAALLQQAEKFFGSWDAARAAAGVQVVRLPAGPPPRWTKEELLEEIRRWKKAGHLTNARTVKRENRSLLHHAEKYFGTWRAACAAAGTEMDRFRPIRGGPPRRVSDSP